MRLNNNENNKCLQYVKIKIYDGSYSGNYIDDNYTCYY